MRCDTILRLAAAVTVLVALGGCASTDAASARQSSAIASAAPRESALGLGLVFASPEGLDQAVVCSEPEAEGWEFSRNDDRLGSPPAAQFGIPGYVRIRTREYLYTSNGRPHEFSTSTTTTIQQGLGR